MRWPAHKVQKFQRKNAYDYCRELDSVSLAQLTASYANHYERQSAGNYGKTNKWVTKSSNNLKIQAGKWIVVRTRPLYIMPKLPVFRNGFRVIENHVRMHMTLQVMRSFLCSDCRFDEYNRNGRYSQREHKRAMGYEYEHGCLGINKNSVGAGTVIFRKNVLMVWGCYVIMRYLTLSHLIRCCRFSIQCEKFQKVRKRYGWRIKTRDVK